jgi:hypothetical protein
MAEYDLIMSEVDHENVEPAMVAFAIERAATVLDKLFVIYDREQIASADESVNIARICFAVFAERLEDLSAQLQYLVGEERVRQGNNLHTVYALYARIIQPGMRAVATDTD